MHNSFDATFKVLLDHSPGDWAQFLFNDALDSAITVDTSLPETSEVVDGLIQVSHGGNDFILHIEFHAGHSGNRIPNRLFHYNAAVMKRFKMTALSCVLILRSEADSPLITGKFVRNIEPIGDIHRFRYHPIRLWKEPLDRFLVIGSSLSVAGVLSDFGKRDLEEAGAEIRRCIDAVSDPERREDMRYHLVVLAGMRFNRSQAESIFGSDVSVLEKYSVTLQYFIRRAEARLLLESAKQIFGAPTPQIIEKVDEASSEKLLAWNMRLRTAQSWSELITD